MKKTYIFFIISISLSILMLGIFLGKILFTSDDKVKENNVNKNEDFANLLITKFNIEDFFYEIYPSSKNINQNLLDEYTNTLVFNQKNLKKYILEYKEGLYDFGDYLIPSLTESITVIKYNDYKEVYKNIFNKEYTTNEFSEKNNFIKFTNMNLKSNIYYGKHDIYSYDEINKCSITEENNCYIMIDVQENTIGGYFPPIAILKNYKVEKNSIIGDIFYKEISEDTPVKAGTFELEYIEKDNNYYLESIKIISVENNK